MTFFAAAYKPQRKTLEMETIRRYMNRSLCLHDLTTQLNPDKWTPPHPHSHPHFLYLIFHHVALPLFNAPDSDTKPVSLFPLYSRTYPIYPYNNTDRKNNYCQKFGHDIIIGAQNKASPHPTNPHLPLSFSAFTVMESQLLSRATSFAGGILSLRKSPRESTTSHVCLVQARPIAEGANLIWGRQLRPSLLVSPPSLVAVRRETIRLAAASSSPAEGSDSAG